MRQALAMSAMLFAAVSIAAGQSQVNSGDLRGTVVDPSGTPIAKAKVTVSAAARGINRSTLTDEVGEYRIPLLEPGVYQVRVEAAGFATRVIEGVVVKVGETTVERSRMEVGTVSTEITVTAETPLIEPERTQQATSIDSRRILNLPINRRNYLDFALLAPGVVETNDLVDGTDFRVVQTPQSGLSFGGGNGRGNAFAIDGSENYLSSGGVRPSVSQEAVYEFQINRNSFNAEFGGAFGGAINIVTKSGTNEFHGNLFGFLRHRDIQARNFFDPGKSAFTRGQYGATFSAPLARDRTFLFAAYERLDRHETAFVPILQDRSSFGQLTASQQQLVNFFSQAPSPQLQTVAGIMRQALITNNYPATLALFNRNSGNFPFAETSNQVSLRIDHHFSPADTMFIRGNYTGSDNQNAQFGALIAFNRGRSLNTFDGGFTVNNTYLFSPRWVSETRAMFDYFRLGVLPTDPFGPDITITGYGSFGRDLFLPSTTFERHFQLQQNFDFTSGRHTVKFGADINPVRITARTETFFSGRFLFGQNIPLASLLNSATGNPNTAQMLAAALTAAGQAALIPRLSDPITALQAYNLGLPTLYQQGFGDPNWLAWFKNYAVFVQDTFRAAPGLLLNVGARYELQNLPREIQMDTNNIAPRIGFAWTPAGTGGTIIRGGYGIYYGPINGQIANIPAALNGVQIAQAAITPLGIPGLTNPLTGRPLTSFDIYQTLLRQGVIGRRSITLADIAQFGLRPGPRAPGRVLFGISSDYVNPYSHQASFELEHAFSGFVLSAGYQFLRGTRLPRTLDRNLFYAGRTPDNQPRFGFYDPSILQYNVVESTANSVYHALVLQASRRFSRNISFNAHYTFSKAIDETTDFNSDFGPNDQLNAKAERALSSFDQRHRLVATGMFESPWRAARDSSFVRKLFGDFLVAPIVIASSGRPFNLLTGFDNLGDNHPTTHRPFGAGRNIGRGPDYFSIDLRLARRFPFGAEGRRNVEVTAEGFNLLNRTNFKNVNNTVGSLQLADLGNPIQGRRGNPIAPLSFTSAFDPRQFQFGLKINF